MVEQISPGSRSAGRRMYSLAWFDAFAATVPADLVTKEIDAIAALVPAQTHPHVIDIGCGTGRTLRPLIDHGYRVTGIDISYDALQAARRRAPEAVLVALDQRDVGTLRCSFDSALILWNSLGFGTREDDAATLSGVRQVLRPGGRLLLDLYHPEWLEAHQAADQAAGRGAVVSRWIVNGRLFHNISYDDGSVDHIEFNVYHPREITELLQRAGFMVESYLVWWSNERAPGPDAARYQVVCS